MVWNPTGNRPLSEPMFVCLTDAYIRYYVPKITVTMKENIVISWNGYAVMYFQSEFMHKVLLICHQFLIMYWECCLPGGGGGGGTRVHHGRVGSAGLCDLKILHPWRRLKKGVKILQWPPNARKGGQYSTSVWKICKKRGQKSTILKNIGVKILQVWKWGSKFYMVKNWYQNSTMLEKRGVNILHPTPKVEVKILHRLKKGGQKGRAYPLPKI